MMNVLKSSATLQKIRPTPGLFLHVGLLTVKTSLESNFSQHMPTRYNIISDRICMYSSSCSWMITRRQNPSYSSAHFSEINGNGRKPPLFYNELMSSSNSVILYQTQNQRGFQTQSSEACGRKLGKSSLGDKTTKFAQRIRKNIAKFDISKFGNRHYLNKQNKSLQTKFEKLSKEISSQNKNVQDEVKTRFEKLSKEMSSQNRNVQEEVKKRIPKTYVKENIKTIPNLLTTLRMGSAPVLAYLIVNDSYGLAFSIFVVAGLTDMLDGYIARNFKNQRTAFGTALDPLADKVLISVLTVSLTSAGLIPAPLTALILGRDAGLILGGFYVRWISLSPPKTMSRYFEFSRVTVKVYPSFISKLNTAFQFGFVAATLASPVFDFVGHPLMQVFMYTTAATTFLSGADYVMTWRKRLKIVKN